jgi:hypothetical protein
MKRQFFICRVFAIKSVKHLKSLITQMYVSAILLYILSKRYVAGKPIQLQLFPIVLLFKSRIGNFPKTLLLVSWAKIQYTRDGEGPDLWNKTLTNIYIMSYIVILMSFTVILPSIRYIWVVQRCRQHEPNLSVL